MNIKKVGIAGAGTMGYSMAQIFAQYGYDVLLWNHRLPTLDRAKNNIDEKYRDLITYTVNMEDLEVSDLIVENVTEDMDIKKGFYKELDPIVSKSTIIATNTSGLSINKLSKAVTHPERFIGFHWFNPPHIIPLIEIIKSDQTSDTVAQTIYDVALSLHKKPAIVEKDVLGFAANRIQLAVLREALDMVDKGVISKEGIDAVMKYGLGFRWSVLGPLETTDFGGLDTFYHVSEYLMPDLCDSKEVPKLLRKNYEQGRLGVKTQAGFYDYTDEDVIQKTKERNEKLNKVYEALYKDPHQ